MGRPKKEPIRFKNTEEVIKALEDTLDIKFEKWNFKQGNNSIDFFVRSQTSFEDITIDTRNVLQVFVTLKDGNGSPIKDDYKNQIFQQFSGTAVKGRDFDEIFDFVIENVNKNREMRRKEAKIDPDGQLWLF